MNDEPSVVCAECGKAINRDDKVYATWKSLRGILL